MMKARLMIAMWGVIGFSLVAGQLYAHGGDPNLIHSCVNNSSGEIKLIAPNGTCKNQETPVDWNAAARTTPGTFSVNCDAGETISHALTTLIAGDTLLVSGTCNENVVISGMTSPGPITLKGQGSATIHGPSAAQATVQISRGGITINGFTITGGKHGIQVQTSGTATISGNTITGTVARVDGIVITRGGEATIDGNTVQNWGRFGINLDQSCTARIINNTVRNNSSIGILVSESSSARIGFLTFLDTNSGPNVIQSNGGDGVNVMRSSSAVVVSNTISDNRGNGVRITGASHADVGANDISLNNANGIFVSENSGVNISQTGLGFDGSNSGTNTQNGIRCRLGAYVNGLGNLGSLTGSVGPTDFSGTGSTCPVNP